MRIQTSNLPLRIGATATGIGYAVVGIFAVSVSTDAPNPELADRALWLGITFLIAAIAAISVTWLVADLSNIWCISPRRSRPPPRLVVNDDAGTQKPRQSDVELSNQERQG